MIRKKISLICFLIVLNLAAFAQRYLEKSFDSVVVFQDIPYGFNYNFRGDSTQLYMDIYVPHNDTATKRPLLALAHGGSFVQGNKRSSDMIIICKRLAEMGYVVVSFQYRLGIDIASGKTLEQEFQQAVWRGAQDGRAAIRFMHKTIDNGDSYKINPAQIYTGGVSAGGVLGLQLAFLDKPNELSTLSLDTNVIGGIEGNSGNPGYPWKVRGVINLCGAMGNVTWMSDNKDVSICSMHGTADATVPYKTDYFKFFGTNVALLNGSFSVDSAAKNYALDTRLYTYNGAPHVPFVGLTEVNKLYMDTTIDYVSRYLYRNVTGNIPSALAEPKLADNALQVYPNPATNWVTVNHPVESIKRMALFSLNGQLLQQWFGSDRSITVPLNQFTSGLYLLQVETTKQTFVKKLKID
jgi:poly(3-hydroxybutyrate) depolymerase